MTFWQENYTFIKDVYDMRHTKMAEWMENVEKVKVFLSFSPLTYPKYKYKNTLDREILNRAHISYFICFFMF